MWISSQHDFAALIPRFEDERAGTDWIVEECLALAHYFLHWKNRRRKQGNIRQKRGMWSAKIGPNRMIVNYVHALKRVDEKGPLACLEVHSAFDRKFYIGGGDRSA